MSGRGGGWGTNLHQCFRIIPSPLLEVSAMLEAAEPWERRG